MVSVFSFLRFTWERLCLCFSLLLTLPHVGVGEALRSIELSWMITVAAHAAMHACLVVPDQQVAFGPFVMVQMATALHVFEESINKMLALVLGFPDNAAVLP
eukprot:m.86049 g.86049  ORF g.86049 m.86049 type:complete len:102 (-) comp14449_c0_seq1:952-1257(-)